MISESDDSDWELVNSWIEGNIRISLKSDGHTHISRIIGAYNMIKTLESVYKFKGYTSREIL